jgi:hypothetical protein
MVDMLISNLKKRLISKYTFSKLWGYFRQFLSIQLDSQLSYQTVKFETAAFSAQQLSLHSSFPCTASQPQPKQTGPKPHLCGHTAEDQDPDG